MADNRAKNALALIAAMIVGVILKGLVLSVMWGWFMVPTFSLPQLSTAQAIGIALVVSYLTQQHTDCEKPKRKFGDAVANAIAQLILTPLVALFVGWLVHAFM